MKQTQKSNNAMAMAFCFLQKYGKCFSSNYGEKLVYSTKKLAADALKTASREQSKKQAIQKPNHQLVIYLGKNKERDTKAFSKRICDC